MSQTEGDGIKVWTYQACLSLNPLIQMPCMLRFLPSSFFSTSRQPLILLRDSSVLQKRRGAQTQQQSPSLGVWTSQEGKKNTDDDFFLMPKPAPGKQEPAVPWLVTVSEARVLLGSRVSVPGLFVISQLIACLSEAFHSFSLTILWPFEGVAALWAKTPGSRFSEAGSPLHCVVHIPGSPFAFSKERASCYSSKSSESWNWPGSWAVKPLVLLVPRASFPP